MTLAKLVLKFQLQTFVVQITPQILPRHDRCVPCSSFNGVWFVDWTSPESKS